MFPPKTVMTYSGYGGGGIVNEKLYLTRYRCIETLFIILEQDPVL